MIFIIAFVVAIGWWIVCRLSVWILFWLIRKSDFADRFLTPKKQLISRILVPLLFFWPVLPGVINAIYMQTAFRYYCHKNAGFVKLQPVNDRGLIVERGIGMLDNDWVEYVEMEFGNPDFANESSFAAKVLNGKYRFSFQSLGDPRCAYFEEKVGEEWGKLKQKLVDQHLSWANPFKNRLKDHCLGLEHIKKFTARYQIKRDHYNYESERFSWVFAQEVYVYDHFKKEKISIYRRLISQYEGLSYRIGELFPSMGSPQKDEFYCPSLSVDEKDPKYKYPGSAIHAKFFNLDQE